MQNAGTDRRATLKDYKFPQFYLRFRLYFQPSPEYFKLMSLYDILFLYNGKEFFIFTRKNLCFSKSFKINVISFLSIILTRSTFTITVKTVIIDFSNSKYF